MQFKKGDHEIMLNAGAPLQDMAHPLLKEWVWE